MWALLDSYFKGSFATDLQLDSYNDMVYHLLPKIIKQQQVQIRVNKFTVLLLEFCNVYTPKPLDLTSTDRKPLYPHSARTRNITYDTQVLVDIVYHVVDTSSNIVLQSNYHRRFELFRIPVMIQSGLCNLSFTNRMKHLEDPYDFGGYFIIKGKERVLMAQERINYNTIYVFAKKSGKYTHAAEVRSVKEDADYSVMTRVSVTESYQFYCSLPYLSTDIPVVVLLIAFGVSPSVIDHPLFHKSTYLYGEMTQEDALEFICNHVPNHMDATRKSVYVQQIFDNELFPHLGIHVDATTKCEYLNLMMNKLIRTCTGQRPPDDRDHICNKRVEMSGDLIGSLFKSIFKRSIKALEQHVQKKEDYNIMAFFQRYNMSQKILHCFTTGNWGLPKSNYIRQGVSQVLSRLSFIGALSHLRRLAVPIGKESKNTDVRQIHNSTYGFVCPVETPEGQACGIIKSFAMGVRLSIPIDTSMVMEEMHYLFPTTFAPHHDTPVFINGIPYGYIDRADARAFVTEFKTYRTWSLIPYSVSIVYNDTDNEVVILSDRGRLLRPVFRVAPGLTNRVQSCSDWATLVRDRWIVYIDGGEAESAYIATSMTDDTTYEYAEIHPSLILSISANLTPFPEHSQAPRNIYHAAQSKQGIGTYTLPFLYRFDTTAHVMHYPQKQLVSTKMMKYSGMEEMPSGHTAIVAIACYSGFNMEDSIIINKSAIERGLFRVTTYKTICAQETKLGTHERDSIERPDKFEHPGYNYDKLDVDGIVRIGATITDHDVVVGKVFYENEQPVRDCSVVCKSNEHGIVDCVTVTVNASGYKLVKIRVRQLKVPEIGDKCASFHAQKSTIGCLMPQEDMPFTRDGIVPDIILNPNAIPSRMTINMLLDILCGKKCVLNGTYQDATAFCHTGEDLVQEASRVLRDKGYDSLGYESMCNGMTGEMLQSTIFIGPTYYQRLKHLVSEKMHARGKGGNIQMMSRQPCAGRSKDGGLRLGEMERDALITHGTASFLKERLLDLSDPYQIDICKDCGAMVHNKTSCMVCGQHRIVRVHIPYACKLLFQNLQALGLCVNLFPDSQ